ncbi:ATP-binding cassette, subfamily B, member 1 [Xylariaceae sp. FL0662B]|nr:ATP-binding cassette, subfamily B, member 1 [Xylariaceae sp. FL0662B]
MTVIFGQFTTRFTEASNGEVDPQAFQDGVSVFVMWFVYLFVGRFVITAIATEASSVAAIRVTRTIRKTFLNCTLRQEIDHFDLHSGSGSVSAQVTTNGARINQGIAERLVILVQAISMLFSSFIVALVFQWKLALITMSIIPAILLVAGLAVPLDAIQEARIVRHHSKATVLAQEAFSSIKTVHAFWAFDRVIKTYDRYLALAHKQGNKKSAYVGMTNAVFYFCMYAGTALAFWQGFQMFHRGEIPNVGTVLTVVLSINMGVSSLSTIAPQLGSITNASAAAAELFAVMDKKSLADPLSPDGEQPDTCDGNIEIRNLSFAYPSRPSAKVFDGLNLKIPAGKTTALVGASGCGKSTIIGLLERWHQPNSGEILLDGVNIAAYNLRWLRSKIRLVQQEPVLFRGSVFENVAKGFVGPQMDLPSEQQMELVEAACKLSNAHDFIQELPDGYHTQVGERASALSGGQKQRLAIARSIISDPKILLLDEATSALDPRSETVVQDALDKVSVNKTTLIIAHRLSTVRRADHIVVMSKGSIVEEGTHVDLLARDGFYAALVRVQHLDDGKRRSTAEAVEEDQQLEYDLAAKEGDIVEAETSNTPVATNLTLGTVNKSLFGCLITMLREQTDLYWWLCILGIACLISGGSYPAQAVLFSKLIVVFNQRSDEAQKTANFFALIYFILAIANMLAYLVIGWVGNRAGQTITHRYRYEMFQRILRLDPDFFDQPQNSSGALSSRLSFVPNSLQDLIAQNMFLMLVCIVNVLASSVLSIASGWKLGLVVVFAGMPVLLGSGFCRAWFERKFERDADEQFAESAALATEAVTSIRTLASLTLESQFLEQYDSAVNDIAKSALFTIAFTSLGYALSQSLEFLLMALGFYYGAKLIAAGEFTTSQFFIVFLAVIFGGQGAAQLFGLITSMTKAQLAANYVLWLRTLKSDICENEDNSGVGPPADGAIELRDLDFRYKSRPHSRVLDGINIEITPGSFVAFVGPSGCGKSTIISLLERFYDPSSGCIKVGGSAINSMSPRLYRDHLSLVQQEPTLYEGSVRDNIAFGLQHEPGDEEILEACRQADAFDFVSSLPEGLDTPCGSHGTQFSGGQRQRIAIARALIRNPGVLLLDEATSALDTQSERLVQQALDKVAMTRTTIAVAHRLSTIKHANTIFVLMDGKVAEHGTHEELLRLRGHYHQMCLAQSLDKGLE